MINLNIIMIRHGDALQKSAGQKDAERPLSPIGISEAQKAGMHLASLNIRPDYIFVSSAIRTRQTAAILENSIDFQNSAVSYLDKLYLCTPETIDEIIANIDNIVSPITILIIGHNPGISAFVGEKIKRRQFWGLSTCEIAVLQFQLPDLQSIFSAKAFSEQIIKPL